MSNDYKDKTVLVVSHGLFAHIAERLTRDFGRVLLYIPWNSMSFPTVNVGEVGYGVPGVERVDAIFGKHLKECDLIIFTDIYFAAEQVHLEELGYRVWGSRNGEELEIYRETCKEVMADLGLPLNRWKKVKGVKALREHLKSNEKQYVKFDKWRGNFETFRSESYDLSEVKVDEIAYNLGAFQHIAEFICEDDLPDCVEIGTDLFTIDGALPSQTLLGIEVKDLGYCGEFKKWESIPEVVRRWNEVMSPVFAKYGYRGWLSNEIRITKDLEPYMIDATCRMPSPPGELCSEFYTNYADILWYGADGVLVDPEPIAKFGIEVIMKSDWAKENWQPIEFDEKFANQIKLFNPMVIEGNRYIVPQNEDMAEIGAIVGWGNSLEEAQEHLDAAIESVEGFGIKIPKGSIEDAKEEMQKLADFGLPVFSLEESVKSETTD